MAAAPASGGCWLRAWHAARNSSEGLHLERAAHTRSCYSGWKDSHFPLSWGQGTVLRNWGRERLADSAWLRDPSQRQGRDRGAQCQGTAARCAQPGQGLPVSRWTRSPTHSVSLSGHPPQGLPGLGPGQGACGRCPGDRKTPSREGTGACHVRPGGLVQGGSPSSAAWPDSQLCPTTRLGVTTGTTVLTPPPLPCRAPTARRAWD